MPKPKSFVKNVSIDVAKREHKCQHVPSHIISNGDKRLKLVVDRSNEYFCVQCAIATIDRDIAKLNEIRTQLKIEL